MANSIQTWFDFGFWPARLQDLFHAREFLDYGQSHGFSLIVFDCLGLGIMSAQRMPEKPTLDGLESKWMQTWDKAGTYTFDRSAIRENVFSIDTPPPTVSGSLHVGHVFSYTHIDCVARYQRMNGKSVFYPMGWDDNGLPTERRVQNYFGVRCDPSLPYDANFQPPAEPGKDQIAISRRNFVELC